MSQQFEPDGDDVLSMEAHQSLVSNQTFRVDQVWLEMVNKWGSKVQQWLHGVDCQILQAQGGGWKKGKVYLRVVFVPDDDADK